MMALQLIVQAVCCILLPQGVSGTYSLKAAFRWEGMDMTTAIITIIQAATRRESLRARRVPTVMASVISRTVIPIAPSTHRISTKLATLVLFVVTLPSIVTTLAIRVNREVRWKVIEP